jgi:hypothetical protein
VSLHRAPRPPRRTSSPGLEHIGAVYDLAGAGGRYAGRLYDAPHRFDLAMQEEAFAWLDRRL